MLSALTQAASELLGRASGPLHLRLILQPVMAVYLAIRAGIGDARSNSPVFVWAILTGSPATRRRLAHDAWQDLAKLFALALTLDLVYSAAVLHALRPLQTLIVVLLVSIVPYVLVRGPTSRLARHRSHNVVRSAG